MKIIGTFHSENENEESPYDHEKEKYAMLKKGEIDIDKIYEIETFSKYMKELSSYSDNPFLPESIQNTLKELRYDVYSNLKVFLKHELEMFMLDFSKGYFKNKTISKINTIGVYNEFNHKRIHHSSTLIKLQKEVRQYLRIDEKW